MHTDAIAEPDECYPPLSPERVQQLKIVLDIWSEAEAAAAYGETKRTWQNRRLTGGDHPPYVRMGRHIIYFGEGMKAWHRTKVTNAADGIKPRAKGRAPA